MARESFEGGSSTEYFCFREQPEIFKGKSTALGVNEELTGYYQDKASKDFPRQGNMQATTKITGFFSKETKDCGFGLELPARLNGIINSLLKRGKIEKGSRMWIKYLGKQEGSHAFKVDWDKEDSFVYVPEEKTGGEGEQAQGADASFDSTDVPF